MLDKSTHRKHTTELAKHRVEEHYTDGPCPDSTGTYDTIITNDTCLVSDGSHLDGLGKKTSTHGELRIGGLAVTLDGRL